MLDLVTSPWLADPDVVVPGTVRAVVRDSWSRAEQSQLDPDRMLSPLLFESSELHDYREAHPLAQMMPVIRKLLVRDADNDSGMLVAVGDAMGRLLWVEGDQGLKSRAESMMFVEGSDWSESVAGTSAPGTALALDHAIQIRRDEHYNRLVHAWSCTAVPVHDPETKAIIGVIDITGGDQAVDRHTMPLVEATAHAVETELMVSRLRSRDAASSRSAANSKFVLFNNLPSSVKNKSARATLHILGRDTALLTIGDRSLELTQRHAEIMTLLAWNRSGLSAERLSELLWGDPYATSRLRPEMVRLRKLLEKFQPGIAPESKPYRLPEQVEIDAQHVVALLDRGAHRAALSAFRGTLLPDSVSPGIEEIRNEVCSHLRESLLSDASVEVLMDYANSEQGLEDLDVWHQVLKMLPAKSPKRAHVVAHVENLVFLQGQ
ncbi:helix-turn-helix domain-containing protein [Aurantimicrobium sp. MWH-Uga1]|uniref:helix-turn-helix domain-containing protein n=1 Tax=Aurantimicrobium sp. MWH-Uga1 TaxID=2079575 RepID=UPI000DED4A8B|nr:helix-turn-helix domain-containing protein [Aurantimicrobium sp. MWH-Uga1]AXE53849.1 Acetoin dehydrogenase operon transcriptional activator AcoR [Aurantimicrobium sp. MWH-Uga1]